MFSPRSTTEASTLYNLILQGCSSSRVLKKSSFVCKTCCFLVGTRSFYFLRTREALSKLLLVYDLLSIVASLIKATISINHSKVRGLKYLSFNLKSGIFFFKTYQKAS